MAKVKGPLFGFKAQGRIGAYVYSTHAGITVVYRLAPTKQGTPSLEQIQQQEVFRWYANHWPDRTDLEDQLFAWIAANQKKVWWKDCKPSSWTAFNAYMSFGLHNDELAGNLAGWIAFCIFLVAYFAVAIV